MANDTATVSDAPLPMAYVPTTRNEVMKVIILGLAAGLLIPLLGWLIAQYFITPVFCHGGGNGGFDVCSSGGVVANHIAAIIVAAGAFAVLMHWAIYRTLLLVVAVTVAMWGLKKYASPLTDGNPLEFALFSALLYGLAYAFFYWILRLRNFALSLILVIVAVVAICWMMAV